MLQILDVSIQNIDTKTKDDAIKIYQIYVKLFFDRQNTPLMLENNPLFRERSHFIHPDTSLGLQSVI